VTLLIWIVARKLKSKGAALVLIPLVIAYSAVMALTMKSIFGFPTGQMMPHKSIIYSMKINEPEGTHKGDMFFWVISKEKFTDPCSMPRSYRMDYDRELHEMLEKMKQEKGGMITWQRIDKKENYIDGLMGIFGSNKYRNSGGKFQVSNPSEMLQKEEYTISTEGSKDCAGACE
jgi:hypothetical protein